MYARNMSYIVRQLRDMEASARIGEVTPPASLFQMAADEIERLLVIESAYGKLLEACQSAASSG